MTSKGFENKESKTERQASAHLSGPNFDVLGLMKMGKDIEKNVGQAVDGLKHLFGQSEQANNKDTHQDVKRNSLLQASEQNQKHVLTGHLSHNETPHTLDTHVSFPRGTLLNRLKQETAQHNPSHLSAFLLKRLHERESAHPTQNNIQQQSFQLEQQSMHTHQQGFDQQVAQNPQPSEAPQWRQDMYNARRDLAQATMDAAVPVVSAMPFNEFNPNNPNVNRADLAAQGMPFTRGVQQDFDGVMEHVVKPVMERRAEKFHSQISNVGHGPFHAVGRPAEYHPSQHLPYAGFQQHTSYVRRDGNYYQAQNQKQQLPYGGFRIPRHST